MKISHSGNLKLASRATISDRIRDGFCKLASVITGKETRAEDPKVFGDVNFDSEFNYEFAIEMTADEMKSAMEEVRKNADKEMELLGRFWVSYKKFAVELREVVGKELPEWIKIFHNAKKELNNVQEDTQEDQ